MNNKKQATNMNIQDLQKKLNQTIEDRDNLSSLLIETEFKLEKADLLIRELLDNYSCDYKNINDILRVLKPGTIGSEDMKTKHAVKWLWDYQKIYNYIYISHDYLYSSYEKIKENNLSR